MEKSDNLLEILKQIFISLVLHLIDTLLLSCVDYYPDFIYLRSKYLNLPPPTGNLSKDVKCNVYRSVCYSGRCNRLNTCLVEYNIKHWWHSIPQMYTTSPNFAIYWKQKKNWILDVEIPTILSASYFAYGDSARILLSKFPASQQLNKFGNYIVYLPCF